MGPPPSSADAFWSDVVRVGRAVADTDVLSDAELLELASGMGPVVIAQRGVEELVTTIRARPAPAERAIFHTEDGPAGERVAWVVLHCIEAGDLDGGSTALASGQAIVDRLAPAEREMAIAAVGEYELFGHARPWRLLTPFAGGWSVDLPGAPRRAEHHRPSPADVAIPDAAHRDAADRVEAVAPSVAEEIEWVRGRVLVFDNRRFLHARTPAVRGERTLQRVLIGPVPDTTP